MHTRKLLLAALVAASSFAHAESPPAADPVGLRGDISGTWYDPAKPRQGLTIEMHDRNEATVSWYTYDTNGQPMWLVGAGSADRSKLPFAMSRVPSGGSPGGTAAAPAATEQLWGNLVVDFTGCDAANLSWTPQAGSFAAGSMQVVRLTSVQGTRCNAAEEFEETRTYSLERGNQDFEAVFADRPAGEEAFYELDYVYERLPAPLEGFRGMRLSGNNHSDDLAMLIKREIRGLKPDTVYRLEIDADIASNVPSGCAGVGGSPGEGAYLKLGASSIEPLARTVPNDDFMRLNNNFGIQSQSGADAKVVGTLANSYSCEDSTTSPWEPRTISTKGQQVRVKTDANGAFWLVAGSDSAFEGRTDFYFTSLTVRFAPVQ